MGVVLILLRVDRALVIVDILFGDGLEKELGLPSEAHDHVVRNVSELFEGLDLVEVDLEEHEHRDQVVDAQNRAEDDKVLLYARQLLKVGYD